LFFDSSVPQLEKKIKRFFPLEPIQLSQDIFDTKKRALAFWAMKDLG